MSLFFDAMSLTLGSFSGLRNGLLRLFTRLNQHLLGARCRLSKLGLSTFCVLNALANPILSLGEGFADNGQKPSPQDQEDDAEADELREEGNSIDTESIEKSTNARISKDKSVHHDVRL